MTPITHDLTLISEKAEGSPVDQPQKLTDGDIKVLDQLKEFNPHHFVNKRIFSTNSINFSLYCLEPGQSNPLHKHPQSDEICYFIEGSGDVIVGNEIVAVTTGSCIHIPPNVGHEIQNTGHKPMIVVLAQSLPIGRENVTVDLSVELRRV